MFTKLLDKYLVFTKVLILPFLIFCFSCQNRQKNEAETYYALLATDSRGNIVSLKSPANRVIVLFYPIVDEIYMLGAEDKIVGVPEQIYLYSNVYENLAILDDRIKNKTIMAPTFSGNSSNIENIIALNADLVIVYDQDKETITQLEQLGIPIYSVSSASQEKILNEMKGLGILLGKEERANEILNFVDKDMKALSEAPKRISGPSVYYAWSKGRVLSTSGKGTLIDTAMELAGARNACPLNLQAPNIGVEILYRWNPDIILLWNTKTEDVYAMKELASLSAVKNKQVYNMQPSFYFDPHTIKFVLFAKQLHQWCFPSDYPVAAFDKEMTDAMNFLYFNKIKFSDE